MFRAIEGNGGGAVQIIVQEGICAPPPAPPTLRHCSYILPSYEV